MNHVLPDLRLAVRALLRLRGVGALAVTTLALGIGATTTMASVAYATIFRQVPFPGADDLAIVYNTRLTAADGLVRLRWSFPAVAELRRSVSSFEGLASFSSTSVGVSRDGPPEQLDGEVVSPEYFALLGAAPIAGRTFAAPDHDLPVVLLSERFWRTRCGADPNVAGSIVRVSDVPLTVLGVLPDGFAGVSGRASLWLPTWMAPRLTYGEYLSTPQHFISAVARLKRGITLARANAELAAVGPRFADVPARAGAVWSVAAVPMVDARVDPTARRSVVLLFSAAACVLLIACVNVASLLLARAESRRRDMAVRLALGASRGRLVRQMLSEGLVLASVAGAIGTVLGAWGVRAVGTSSPAFIASWRNDYAAVSPFADPAFDPRIVLFAIGLTLFTTVLCAIAPARAALRPHLSVDLRQGDRGATRQRRGWSWLVVTEIAMAVWLLCAAGILIDTFMRLDRFRTGFVADRVLSFWIRPAVSRYKPSDGPVAVERFLSAIEAVPGVASAAVDRCTPFMGCARTTLTIVGRSNDVAQPPAVGRHYISAAYFDTLGIPVLAGRALTAADRAGTQPVAVINETAARRFWPGQNPIGRQVRFGSTTGFTDPAHPVEVVGIVGDVKFEGADQPVGPDFYTSYLQFSFPDTMVVVKARGEPAALVPALREAVAGVDPAVPIYDVMTLDDRVSAAMGRPRFNTTILAGFAGAALLLAALGVYGLLSYVVSSRIREIGVRLALGATPDRILRQVVGRSVRLGATGAAIGVVAVIVLTRAGQAQVADLGPVNVPVLALVSLVMTIVAAAAAWLPARRASVVDPIVVLRQE